MQLGFVIDHSRCIGCHACTVACKAENDVPLGSFRTWVKYTEAGSFPDVKRSFAVLRCNQCTDAPCITICPVRALEKREDGIVDIDPAACIGCKACLQGCPYDALYINDASGTAQKCHFCAHRTEVGLAPACAVVCPTEAIVPGDFDDPSSRVSRMKAVGDLVARKVEAGTGPNVLYKEVGVAGLDPQLTNAAGGFLWTDRFPGPQLDAQEFEAMESQAQARTVYDVAHPPVWGGKVSAYLFTKSLSAGCVLAAGLLGAGTGAGFFAGLLAPLALAMLFLIATSGLLVADLKRPGRFLYILIRPNLSSWVARGTLVLMAYGALLTMWIVLDVLGRALPAALSLVLFGITLSCAALTAAYTAWLFGQAKGRVLWMRRGLSIHLVVQATVAGCGLLLAAHLFLGLTPLQVHVLRLGLLGGLLAHVVLTFAEGIGAPPGRREEYRRAVRLLTRGPYAWRHWWIGMGLGAAVPLVLLLMPELSWLWAIAAVPALVGLYVEEDLLVRAGQALSIS